MIFPAYQKSTYSTLLHFSYLKVEIWDKDLITDEFMGQFQIPLSKLLESPKFEMWIDGTHNYFSLPNTFSAQPNPKKPKIEVSGQVLVAVRYLSKAIDADAEKKIKEKFEASLLLPEQAQMVYKEFEKVGSIDSPQELKTIMLKLEPFLEKLIKYTTPFTFLGSKFL